jgi:GH25 family lysozyme M1 (1,4-beta-N-acetylmuramidase)/peptidoglycan hydrolase-like protein with peptidoglycan-binding domain
MPPALTGPARRRIAAGCVAVLTTAALAVASAPATSAATTDTRPLGIDVSVWQRPYGAGIDWNAVRSSGRSFVFIRATYGTTVDRYLASNWAGAERAGLYRAAYHFALPSRRSGSAQEQARAFVAAAGRHQDVGDLAPVLDLETDGGLSASELRTWAQTWLTTVESLTGRIPVIYTSPYFWGQEIGSDAFSLITFPFWVAHWTSKQNPDMFAGATWLFWQYSSTGRVAGIKSAVDLNRFNGTAAELRAVAHPGTHPTFTAPSSLAKGSAGRFSGHLRSLTGQPVTRARVTLYQRTEGSSTWAKVATTTTSSVAASYRFTYAQSNAAAYQVRYLGGNDFAQSVSATRSVRLATATTPQATPAPAPPVATSSNPYAWYSKTTLRQGSKGAAVTALQKALRLTADGYFGPRTKAAVIAYQRSHRLTADGIVGPVTWRTLAGQPAKPTINSTPKPKPAPKPKPQAPALNPYTRTTLLQGSKGAAVTALQKALRLTADGYFGPRTKAAVIAYQRSHRLTADSIVGPVTWRTLAAQPASPPNTTTPRTTPTKRTAPARTTDPYAPYAKSILLQGSKGAAVTALQKALRLTADGYFGPRTKAAVIAYQRSHRLTADGIVGPVTWRSLARR